MTESEWLSSDDPAAMLSLLNRASVVTAPDLPNYVISDRKLRLFACACRHLDPTAGWDANKNPGWVRMDEDGADPEGGYSAEDYARLMIRLDPELQRAREQASFLREIVGNPFRPIILPKVFTREVAGMLPDGRFVASRGDLYVPAATCPWLTPDVLTLAEAAYEERGRKCYRCGGNKTNRVAVNRDHTKHQDMPCSDCNGTGTIDDGTLDPARLAVLSDALEESGCDNEAILMHLRSKERCSCDSTYDAYSRGCPCNGSGWICSPGPHVRGCHVIDLLLGRE